MGRRLIALMLASSMLCIVAIAAKSDDGPGHWKIMERILFGREINLNEYSGTKEQKNAIKILRYATQLSIDQSDDNCQSYLDMLQKLKVPRLPDSIASIACFPIIPDKGSHRMYTHRGWNLHLYKDDSRNPDWRTKRWPARQQLLRDAVDYVFNFNKLPRWMDTILVIASEEQEAFCAFLYYIHILGDHAHFKSYSNYQTQSQYIIPLGGFSDITVISELQKYLIILFGPESLPIIEKLNYFDTRVRTILNDPSLKENFSMYTNLVTEIIDYLSENIPRRLSLQPWWTTVFPN